MEKRPQALAGVPGFTRGTFPEAGDTWARQALGEDNELSFQHVELAVTVCRTGRNGH